MFLSKLFKRTRARVITALAGMAMIVGAGAAISSGVSATKNEVTETKAATPASVARIYVNLNWATSGPFGGNSNWDPWGTSIDANPSSSIPASGTTVCSTHHYVYDFDGGSNYLRFTYYQGSDRWVPWRNGQTRDNQDGGNNSLGLNDEFSQNFANGYIYYLSSLTYKSETTCWDFKDLQTRKLKWFSYTLTANGVFVHYDLNGGSFSDSHSVDEEQPINADLTLPAAPTKDGYTFMGWEASTNGILNRADTSFRITQPMTFKAIWHSTSLSVIPNDSVRVWVGYDATSGSVDSLMYAGADKEMKLWIHQGNGSAGSAEQVIAASGTYYANGESINGLSNCPRRYDYFDVPLSYVKAGYYVNLQRFSGSSWEKTSAQTTISSDDSHAFKVLYVAAGSGSWNIAGYYGLDSSAPDPLFAAIALCGIHTCSSEIMNGYKGYSNYYGTFVQNAAVESGLSSFTISDYANGDTSYAGSATNSVSAMTKYTAVSNMNSKGNPNGAMAIPSISGTSPLTMTLWIVLGAGLAGLAAIGTAYFVSKKKKRYQA